MTALFNVLAIQGGWLYAESFVPQVRQSVRWERDARTMKMPLLVVTVPAPSKGVCVVCCINLILILCALFDLLLAKLMVQA